MADLSHFLEVAGRATADRSEAHHLYKFFKRGRGARARPTGPREVHVVMLDNGRQQKCSPTPVLREALYCLRCGAVPQRFAPIYRRIGGHGLRLDLPGANRLDHKPEPVRWRHGLICPFASNAVRARCREICPVKIDIPGASCCTCAGRRPRAKSDSGLPVPKWPRAARPRTAAGRRKRFSPPPWRTIH